MPISVTVRTGNAMQFPPNCVYCMQPARVTRSFRVTDSIRERDGFDSEHRVEAEIAGVPYCAEHGRQFDALSGLVARIEAYALVAGIGVAATGFLLALAIQGYPETNSEWFLIAIGSLLVGFVGGATVRRFLRSRGSGNHPLLSDFDGALGVQATLQARLEKAPRSGKTAAKIEFIALSFRNEEYGRRFAECNLPHEAQRH